MAAPRIDQINLVVPDAAATARFLRDLGVGLPDAAPGWEAWEAHHVAVPAAEPFAIDLDSSAFAQWWGALPEGTGIVVNVRADEREDVDRLHALAIEAGATSLKAPHDAFWGSRFTTVLAPGPVVVGVMSPMDDAHRSTPPDISDFA